MIEKPYVNCLSGDTLPTYSSVQKHFQRANSKEMSLQLLKNCLTPGFVPDDVEAITRFYENLMKMSNDKTLQILYNGEQIPKVRFGKLRSDTVSFDTPMEYLENPEVIVAEVVISTDIWTTYYQGRDLGERIEELQTKLNGAGIESTINLGDVDKVGKRLCSLSLTVPPYEKSSFQDKKRNAYQKLVKPDYSRLDELVNAVELV